MLMGYNQLSIDIPQEYFLKAEFPIDFTTTQIEGAVPDLTLYTEYDLPMSAKFKNLGAPRFIFNDEEMSVLFDMEVEFFDEGFDTKLMSINYYDMYIDFDMWLEDMELKFEWFEIEMGSAEVKSDLIENLEETNANQHVVDYFNWAFMAIVPWVNDSHVENVSFFYVPDEIPGVMLIHELQMSIEENFFKFSMDPEFKLKVDQQVDSGEQKFEHHGYISRNEDHVVANTLNMLDFNFAAFIERAMFHFTNYVLGTLFHMY